MISAAKTGFLFNQKELEKELQKHLTEEDPPIVDVMRDLGCETAVGRLRRIKVTRARQAMAKKKQKKMQTLRIPHERIKVRLCKGSIQAGSQWGCEAMGQAPRYRQMSSLALARCLGLQAKGSKAIVYDMNPNQQDPAVTAVIKQVRVFHHLYGNWLEEQKQMLQSAWQHTYERLKLYKRTQQRITGSTMKWSYGFDQGTRLGQHSSFSSVCRGFRLNRSCRKLH